jgi:ABC-type multidrug transport system ATPase subunit
MTVGFAEEADRSSRPSPDFQVGAGAAMTEATPAFEVVGLRKTFGETVAVDHVELSVRQGSFFGLVGPNGAGKSTTIAMAVGLLRPDRGVTRIFGIDV